jgi:hypothetical protein
MNSTRVHGIANPVLAYDARADKKYVRGPVALSHRR